MLSHALRFDFEVESARDSVQEVITRMLERKSYLKAEGDNKQLRGWLLRSVKNQALNDNRRKKDSELHDGVGAVDISGERLGIQGKRQFFPSKEHGTDDSSPDCALPRVIRNNPDPLSFDVEQAVKLLSKRDRFIVTGLEIHSLR